MSEYRKRRQKRQAVLGVVIFALLQLLCAVFLTALCFIPDLPRWVFRLSAALAGLCGLLVVPALVVLYQRFHEIEGGESDAAAEY